MKQIKIKTPTLLKRLLASVYDGFLILTIVFIAVAIKLVLTGDEATSENNIYMSLYLLTVIYVFFAWFWTHGGQTLGMRSWKQKLVPYGGGSVNWKQSFIRFITGLPAWGLFIIGFLLWVLPDKITLAEWLLNIPRWLFVLTGFVWVLLDNRNNNWRDKLSGTHIIMMNDKTDVSKE